MSNVRILTALSLCLVLLFTGSVLAIHKADKITRDVNQVVQLTKPVITQPARDEDDLLTYRFAVSADGGETWSEIMGTGDHGMYEITGEGDEVDTVGAWGGASYDMGTVVDMDNNIHFIAILNAYSEDYNPLGRSNGLYDVASNAAGDDIIYTLIAEEEGGVLTFSDAGIDAAGNLYAIWAKKVTPDEGAAFQAIYAARTVDGQWGDAVMLVDGLDATHCYPHMTYTVGDYFWVIYEMPNAETGRYDHYTIKVSADLSEVGDPLNTGASSSHYFSYYVTAVNAIDQDVTDGYVYFTTLNDYNVDTYVGSMMADGQAWTIESLDGPSRYPGMMMWPDADNGGVPWIFSNVGPPASGEYHFNWYRYDALGYNGGDWTPMTPVDSTMYDGTRSILYCHQGVVTSEGRLVSGCNVWGQFTPEGFHIKYSDDMGISWSDPYSLWSIFDEGETFMGGFITQNHILAGMDNTVWVAFCGQYGETDFDPPMIEDITLSSFNLNEPWMVSANVFDAVNGIGGVEMYWTNQDPLNPDSDWDGAEPDSAQADEETGDGMYFFTLPSDTILGEALENGDEVWFFLYAWDGVNNELITPESKIVVGQEWFNVKEGAYVPVTIKLGQNYPNPFNSSTMIPFSIDRNVKVSLRVFDLNGRLVETLHDGPLPAGNHEFSWQGDGVSTGIYFYVLETLGQQYIAKMSLIR